MARTATETATILSDLYDETFANDPFEPYRITWPQLRSLAALPRLNDAYQKDIATTLSETGHTLIPCDDFFLIAKEHDLAHFRMLPDRVLEQYLPDETETTGGDDESDSDDYEIEQ